MIEGRRIQKKTVTLTDVGKSIRSGLQTVPASTRGRPRLFRAKLIWTLSVRHKFHLRHNISAPTVTICYSNRQGDSVVRENRLACLTTEVNIGFVKYYADEISSILCLIPRNVASVSPLLFFFYFFPLHRVYCGVGIIKVDFFYHSQSGSSLTAVKILTSEA